MAPPVEPDRTSHRPVRAIGLLLILEFFGLVALGAYELSRVDWRGVVLGRPPREAVEAAAVLLFAPSAALALLAALGFLILRRRGWLLAAISQGLALAVCLWLYAGFRPGYVYPIMAFCVLMILYLNLNDVRAVFHREQAGGGAGAPR